MLNKDDIRKIVFENYSYFIEFAKKKYVSLKYRGVPPDELVNEAIVNIFDVTLEFSSEKELLKFIEKSIFSNYMFEKELLKENNFCSFIENKSSKKLNIDSPSEEFIETYNIFELCRFKINNSEKKCTSCGFNKFFQLKNGWLKCKACGKKLSITSKTYFHNLKLSYVKTYKIIKLLSRDSFISSVKLSKIAGITQKTAYNRKYLIDSVINTIKSKDVNTILQKILTHKEYDEIKNNGIDFLEKNKRKFNLNQILEIRRLSNEKVYNLKEIAEIFGSDPSTICKIVKFKIYKHSNL